MNARSDYAARAQSLPLSPGGAGAAPLKRSGTPLRALGTVSALAAGGMLNNFAYGSYEPVLVALLFWLAGASLLRFTPLGGSFESAIFNRMFFVTWFMAGIAAFYANFLGDPFQNFSDAARFYDLARSDSQGLSMEKISEITEGSAAVVLWRTVYDAFAVAGFAKGRYIGVLINVLAIAFAAVASVKTARLLYGEDMRRFRRLSSLFSLCGLLWLFAALHLRDAVIMLTITGLVYAWVRYLSLPVLQNIFILVAATLAAFAFFGYFREEFLFVPLAFLFAGLVAALVFTKHEKGHKLMIYVTCGLGALVLYGLYLNYQEGLLSALTTGNLSYSELSAEQSSVDSLGMSIIVKQAMPIRLLLGSAYLLIYPIPFWMGFQLESIYGLFKSFNAIFFYFVAPLLCLALLQIGRDRQLRTSAMMFLVFLIFGFTLAIAGTSLETRHFGAFLAPIFLVALVPDPASASHRNVYRQLLLLFLFAIAMIHVLWAALKFL